MIQIQHKEQLFGGHQAPQVGIAQASCLRAADAEVVLDVPAQDKADRESSLR